MTNESLETNQNGLLNKIKATVSRMNPEIAEKKPLRYEKMIGLNKNLDLSNLNIIEKTIYYILDFLAFSRLNYYYYACVTVLCMNLEILNLYIYHFIFGILPKISDLFVIYCFIALLLFFNLSVFIVYYYEHKAGYKFSWIIYAIIQDLKKLSMKLYFMFGLLFVLFFPVIFMIVK